MTSLLRALCRPRFGDDRECGQALAEYGLVLALVAVVAIVVVVALGLAIAGQLGAVAGAL